MRLALITNIPAPYRVPVWELLSRKTDTTHVFFCVQNEPNRVWDIPPLDNFSFGHTFLPGLRAFVPSLDWGVYFNPSLWSELKKYKPTHILFSGYETPSYLFALLFAKIYKIPTTLLWESHAMSSRFAGGIVFKTKKRILRQFNSFCAIGTEAEKYLIERIGIQKNRIFHATNNIDPLPWHTLAHPLWEHRKDAFPVRFLYVGQFIKRKGVIELLKAFMDIPASKGYLKLVGYGPDETIIREYIAAYNMINVEIAGATKHTEETAKFYAWADICIVPSLLEVWGLVVNEALACGTYVMASQYAGATHDMVVSAPYDVGESFDPANINDFHARIQNIIDRHVFFNRQTISEWGLKHTAALYAENIFAAVSLASNEDV